MDQGMFDRVARLLGGATSRRSGLRAALAAVAGHAVLTAPEAASAAGSGKGRAKGSASDGGRQRGKGSAKPAGPCGDGSVKENRCSRNSQCCTNLCKLKGKGQQGEGRCRCQRRGLPCTQDRNCCRGLPCSSGICGGKSPAPTPEALVENGSPCDAATDTCRDPMATCVAYDSGDPAGTYCLLARHGNCASANDCVTQDCEDGVCIACTHPACREACTPTVCATCTYTKVQEAIDAAASGDVIAIGEGLYREQLTIDGKDLTLRACPGESVVLRNPYTGSSDRRTITVTGGALDIIGITVAGLSYPNISNYSKGGGIKTDGNLGLYRNAAVTTAYAAKGGGVLVEGDNLTLKITDEVRIESNSADTYGAGVLVDGESEVIVDSAAVVRSNRSDSYGGGVAVKGGCNLTLADRARVVQNVAKSGGGIAFMNGDATRITTLQVSGDVVISQNSSSASYQATRGGGGGVTAFGNVTGSSPATITVTDRVRIIDNIAFSVGGGLRLQDSNATFDEDALVSGNQSDTYGAGIHFKATRADEALTITGQASITENRVSGQGCGAGVNIEGGSMTLSGTASITSNWIEDRVGGGVCLNYNYNSPVATSLTVDAGASIKNNLASQMGGGGVYSYVPENTLTAASGTIVDNIPDNCGGYGITC